MGTMNYKEYLVTPYWTEIKHYIRGRFFNTCEYCYLRRSRETHHRIYNNSWFREDTLDLMGVCHECHDYIEKRKKGTYPNFLPLIGIGSPAFFGDNGFTLMNQWPGHWMSPTHRSMIRWELLTRLHVSRFPLIEIFQGIPELITPMEMGEIYDQMEGIWKQEED